MLRKVATFGNVTVGEIFVVQRIRHFPYNWFNDK
jgi:hypothetical protein